MLMLLTAQRVLPDGIRSCVGSGMVNFTLPAERIGRYPQLIIAILQVKSTRNVNNNGSKMSTKIQRDHCKDVHSASEGVGKFSSSVPGDTANPRPSFIFMQIVPKIGWRLLIRSEKSRIYT